MTDDAFRKGVPYAENELEMILLLAPTAANIATLSRLLGRDEDAIEIVFKIAYEKGPFGQHADAQRKKIADAKTRLGIHIGPSIGRVRKADKETSAKRSVNTKRESEP